MHDMQKREEGEGCPLHRVPECSGRRLRKRATAGSDPMAAALLKSPWHHKPIRAVAMDTLGFEPRAFRMRSGCDTTTPCAPVLLAVKILICACKYLMEAKGLGYFLRKASSDTYPLPSPQSSIALLERSESHLM